MPTDIRSFFSKAAAKKSSGNKKTTTATTSSSKKNGNSATSNNLSGSRRKAGGGASVAPIQPEERNQEMKKKKRLSIQEDSDDNDNEVTPAATSSAAAAVATNKKKRKSDEAVTENRVEMSASDFFAKSKSDSNDNKPSAPSPPSSTTAKPAPALSPSSPNKRVKSETDQQETKSPTKTTRTTTVVKSNPSPAKKKKDKLTIELEDTSDEDDHDKDEDFQAPSEKDASDNDSDILEVVESPKNKKSKTSPAKTKKEAPPRSTAKTKPVTKPQTTSSARKKTTATKTSSSPPRAPPLKPIKSNDFFDVEKAAAECLKDYTFVLTGVLPDGGSRQDATDWVKGLGGRVTTAVSSKTDYLVLLGPTLEDGRPSTEGKKYEKASSLSSCQIVDGKAAFLGLIEQYSDLQQGTDTASTNNSKEASNTKSDSTVKPASKPSLSNPYAKKVATNPYAKKTNPYASSKPAATISKPAAAVSRPPAHSKEGDLWVDRYKPQGTDDILGNQESVRKLRNWLAQWEDRFNKDSLVGKAFSNPQGPWKAALLSGPPGIGKTTTATLVAREAGREVVEYNASDVRSQKAMKDTLGDITGSRSIQFQTGKKLEKRTKRCIIMDEVDGMGAGDRSGVSQLIQMIKHSRVPIICICNDRQAQKLKSLIPYCMDLKYRRPTKQAIAKRAVEVGAREGLAVEFNAAEAMAESCGNDVRQVLNALQMWASTDKSAGKNGMTYRDLRERERAINKDEILRVSLFDAARLLLEGRRGISGTDEKKALSHFMHRCDAFFVDYGFTGLLVQQNYLKVVQGQFNEAKRSNNKAKIEDTLDRMYKAAESMSDYAHVENKLRTEQNWSVLPFVGAMVVKTGYHAGSETGGMVPGFPEFTSWLGRNSSKGKRARLLSEMSHHMNYKISGGGTEMRLSYLPTMRTRFASLLGSREQPQGTEDAIALMDEYGLDRDDVLEKMDEFKMDAKEKSIAQLMDSKKKAAFTRVYNAGVHKSQALVAEQGKVATKKKKASASSETVDPDAIDDDNVAEEEESEDEEIDAAKLATLFKKKGRKPAAKKTAAKKGATSKGKGSRKK